MVVYICQRNNEMMMQLSAEVKTLREELARVNMKAAAATEEISAIHVAATVEKLNQFLQQLEDDPKTTLNYLATKYGERSIGKMVRHILKATMTDELMSKFNRTGTNNKITFPATFESCIQSIAKSFIKDTIMVVRRHGSTVSVTVRQEVSKEREIYIANSKTRLTRRPRD